MPFTLNNALNIDESYQEQFAYVSKPYPSTYPLTVHYKQYNSMMKTVYIM